MKSTDTIGLTEFLVLVYSFFKRNFPIVLAFTAIGVISGVLYTKLKPDYFSSELVGYSSVVDQTTLLEILNPISLLVEEKNFKDVGSFLQLSGEEASEIRSISFGSSRHTVTSHSPSTTDQQLGQLILVEIEVYNKSVLSKVESGLHSFLQKNPFVSKSLELELRKTEVLIEDISNNIHVMDSLNYDPQSSSGSSITIKGQLNPVNYNEAIAYVESLKNRLELLEPFTVVSGFFNKSKPSNNNLVIITGLTVAFFLLSLLVIILREIALLARKNQEEM